MNDSHKTWLSEKKWIPLVGSVYLAITLLLIIGLIVDPGYFEIKDMVIAGLFGFLTVSIILGLLIFLGHK